MKNSFIVVCGGEGSGKSSQLERLKSILDESLWVFAREPGGSPFAEVIRDAALRNPLAKYATPQTLFGLMWASRSENLDKTVRPALKAGKAVLCDRFDCCSYAYQIFGQECAVLNDIFWDIRKAFCGETIPSLYIFLDVEPEVGLARMAQKKGTSQDHFDARDLAFHKRIQEGYRDFLSNVPHVVIDANRSFEDVAKDFERVVRELAI